MAQEKSGINHVKSSVLFPKLCLQGIRYSANWIFFFFSPLWFLKRNQKIISMVKVEKAVFFFFNFFDEGKARSAGIVYWLLCLW